MRLNSVAKNLGTLLASLALISACSTPPKVEEPKVVPVVEAPVVVKPDTRVVETVKAVEVDPLTDPKGVLSKRSVYFDYDKYDIKEEFKSLIEAHASYLVKNKARTILVQGNADERGGREYNLALGQKRAEAVRKALALLGVAESQVEAVSLGEEKPKATGSDEASWAENRRSDIVYK
ncbi:MAG: peptidoglycan-associated lipoprotein Pal [Undibacterium sp.]|nr:peptidoglycan-associated lipoprotein Pal [Undibacterium sp.]